MNLFEKFVTDPRCREASDIHLKVGQPPILRANGHLYKQDTPPLSRADMMLIIEEILPAKLREKFDDNMAVDFAGSFGEYGRYRINLFGSNGEPTLALRHVKSDVPSFEDLHLPPVMEKIAMAPRGIIIMAGATGSGKSTTLAAMINYINAQEFRRILTIEDPIEYIFMDDQSAISQREVGLDTVTFFEGLKSGLRQDPDVIMIGELRDEESFDAAMTASETGHLIMTSLHADNAPQAINRILDIFPPAHHDQLRGALANNLRAVICQRLVPDNFGTVRPAVEVMINTPVVSKLIRENNLDKLGTAIASGKEDGMMNFNASLLEMIRSNAISEETGLRFATNPDALKMNLKGIFLDSGGSQIIT